MALNYSLMKIKCNVIDNSESDHYTPFSGQLPKDGKYCHETRDMRDGKLGNKSNRLR